MKNIPRPEYPRPQFQRDAWLNLNGEWTCALDPGKSGREQGYAASTGFSDSIIVPFCPESTLSGVAHTDFIEAMWYHRRITVPRDFAGKRILLHFGGVDYESEVFVDGRSVGTNRGGAVGFALDITNAVTPGQEHNLVVSVRDDTRSGVQPAGKQRFEYEYRDYRASYTRVTGIWQTVWLEATGLDSIYDVQVIPDIHGGRFTFVPEFRALRESCTLRVTVLSWDGEPLVSTEVAARTGVPVALEVPNASLWSPSAPVLYRLKYELLSPDGSPCDEVHSYAGLREVRLEGDHLYLNGEPLYQRLILDQGYYPDGVWTAPSDEALRRDIELSMNAGFNGARLHQKVFEERYHYWADILGYLTWAEFPSWGMSLTDPVAARNFLSEWGRALTRDRNHPSIIAWTPLNETRQIQANPREHNLLHADAYDVARRIDPTRPVNDASGYIHVKTDLWTIHNYTQDPEQFRGEIAPEDGTGVMRRFPEWEVEYGGQPYIVAEFGGILWISPSDSAHSTPGAWGYGTGPQDIEEFYARLEGLVSAILSQKHIRGYCYTQLTDVEQEQNGIYTYDRKEKFDMKRIQGIFSKGGTP